jgi:small subunit ribosomal protein S6
LPARGNVAGMIHKEDQPNVSERLYEILFIADPNLGEPEVAALTTTVSGFIEKEAGKIQKVENWGKKRLAYNIKKQREGTYVLIVADAEAKAVKEIERRMRVLDGVIKFQTVRVDEDLKKAERQKARRTEDDNRKRARTGRPAPAPAPAAAADVEGGQA